MPNDTRDRTAVHAVGAALALACAVAFPTVAVAATVASDPIDIVLGVLTLAAAVFLLVVALGLEKVAEGSAMADHMRWVMLAAICIAGNVLVVWVARFMSDPVATTVTRLAADGLMILGIVFLCVYFYRVRAAMLRFLNFAARATEDVLAQVQSDDPEALPGTADAAERPPGPSEPPSPDATA